MSSSERQALREIADLRVRLAEAHRRIAYLERDRRMAIERARKAKDQGRYWHGVAIAKGRA